MSKLLTMFLAITALSAVSSACSDGKDDAFVIKRDGQVFLRDKTGEEWNVTEAATEYKMEANQFHYGLGRNAFQPLNNPQILQGSSFGENSDIFGFSFGGVSRSYSKNTLLRHETVNDRFGSTPVLIAYCFLAELAGMYERTVDGQVLTLVASGWTYHNGSHDTFVLYDQETNSLWFPFSKDPFFVAVQGPLKGKKLQEIQPATRTNLGQWKAQYQSSGHVE